MPIDGWMDKHILMQSYSIIQEYKETNQYNTNTHNNMDISNNNSMRMRSQTNKGIPVCFWSNNFLENANYPSVTDSRPEVAEEGVEGIGRGLRAGWQGAWLWLMKVNCLHCSSDFTGATWVKLPDCTFVHRFIEYKIHLNKMFKKREEIICSSNLFLYGFRISWHFPPSIFLKD